MLFDRANDRYLVIDGDTLYVYEPPPATDGLSLVDALGDRIAALVASDATDGEIAGGTVSDETATDAAHGRRVTERDNVA